MAKLTVNSLKELVFQKAWNEFCESNGLTDEYSIQDAFADILYKTFSRAFEEGWHAALQGMPKPKNTKKGKPKK